MTFEEKHQLFLDLENYRLDADIEIELFELQIYSWIEDNKDNPNTALFQKYKKEALLALQSLHLQRKDLADRANDALKEARRLLEIGSVSWYAGLITEKEPVVTDGHQRPGALDIKPLASMQEIHPRLRNMSMNQERRSLEAKVDIGMAVDYSALGENPHYLEANKVLFNAHLQRLKRSAKPN